jgi:lipopolysaccharide export system protein LptC
MSRTATPHRPAEASLYAEADMTRLRAAAFHKARRHSRRVGFLRYALPAAVIGGLAIIVLFAWFDPLRVYRGLPLEFGKLSISGNKLTMEAPRLTGFTRDQQPYVVTAEAASQDLSKPTLVELTNIVGRVDRADKSTAELRAKYGIYDTKDELINLYGVIEIEMTGGYKAWVNDALVEVRKGHIVSKNPVDVVFPDGTLHANGGIEIFEHGTLAVFSDGVVMNVTLPPPAKPEAKEENK